MKTVKESTKSKVSKSEKNKRKTQDNREQPETEQMIEEVGEGLTGNGSFWDLISPDGISIKDDDRGVIKQSLGTKTHFRPLYIPRDGWPRKLATNWLNPLISSGECDVMIDIHKMNKTLAVRTLQRQLTMLQSNLSWQKKRGNIDQINELNTKIQDTEILMDECQFNENDVFDVSVIATVYAENEKLLDRYCEALDDEYSGIFVKLASAFSRVKQAYLSCLPIGKNYIRDSYRNLDRRALSTFSPFISGSGKYIGGIPIGMNKITGQKEFLNSFGNEDYRPQNYNVGFLGIPGSGKSLAMKLKIARESAGNNTYFRIIDPEGEFKRLTKRLGGINLDIHEESDIRINPCAINYTDVEIDDDDDEELLAIMEDHEKVIIERDGKKYYRTVMLKEKFNELLVFFDIIMRGNGTDGLTVFERNYLEKAIAYVYTEVCKITSHPDSLFEEGMVEKDGQLIQSMVRKPEPTITQIFQYLKDIDNPHCERLKAAIEPFLATGSKPLFDGQTNLGRGVTGTLETARLVNFNISHIEEGFLKPIAYHVLLNYSWEYFAKNTELSTIKKFIVCDEIWQMVNEDQTVDFFEKVSRRARKRHCGLMWASQDFVRLLEHPKARAIVTTTFTIMFMQQNQQDLKRVKESFDLTDGEIDVLFSNPEKGEGILRYGNNRIWLRTDPSEEEMTFIESNEAHLKLLLERKRIQQRGA